MLNISIFLIVTVLTAAPCFGQIVGPGAPPSLVYIWGDPHIFSVNKGYETCSYSSPAWLATFIHPQLSIESVFNDLNPGNARNKNTLLPFTLYFCFLTNQIRMIYF